MLDRKIAYIHIGLQNDVIVAMAVTGLSGAANAPMLIIDYLAVNKEQRGQGFGRQFLNSICDWASNEHRVQGIIIEVEAGKSDEHTERILFWERCGFILTTYIHQYIWVPEPYQAMLLPLDSSINVPDDGQSLFRYINSFHKKAYRQR
ncbi:MAG: GNAT family N-acetyltransferase [Paenibacillus sp.]|nr:GNAT family N-acetyltransferase [Paenibacillus sp.]